MIIETMTDEEIIRQLQKDMPEVETKIMSREKEFRRMVIKSNAFPFSAQPILITATSRNRWIVIFRALSRKERKHICYDHCTFICTASFSRGVHAFINPTMLTKGSREVRLIAFQPHFFARFRERTGLRKSGIDLIANYFLKNYSYYYGLQDECDKINAWPKTRVYGTSSEGIGLGIMESENRTVFKTFITYVMMHKAQFSAFTENEILRQREIAQYQSPSRHLKTPGNSPVKIDADLQGKAEFGDPVRKAVLFTKAYMRDAMARNGETDIQTLLDGLYPCLIASIDTTEGISEQDQLMLKNLIDDAGTYLKNMLTGLGFDPVNIQIPDDEETGRLISAVHTATAKVEREYLLGTYHNTETGNPADIGISMLRSIINNGEMQQILTKP